MRLNKAVVIKRGRWVSAACTRAVRPAPGNLSCNADADTVPSSQSPSLCPISLPSLLHLAHSCSKPVPSLGPHCLHTCSCWAPGRMRGSLSPVSHRLNELPTASISADEQMSLLPVGPIMLESHGPGFLSPNLHSMQTAPLSESAQNMSTSQHPTATIPSASPQLCPVPLEFIHLQAPRVRSLYPFTASWALIPEKTEPFHTPQGLPHPKRWSLKGSIKLMSLSLD